MTERYIGSAEVENFVNEVTSELPIDSHVSFVDKQAKSLLHGVVKWTGRHRVSFDGMMVVVVMVSSSSFLPTEHSCECKYQMKAENIIFLTAQYLNLKIDSLFCNNYPARFESSSPIHPLQENKHKLGSSGIFLGQRLVNCKPKRALLIGAEQLEKVEPLAVGDLVQDILQPSLQGHVLRITAAKNWPNSTAEVELVSGQSDGR